MDSIYEDYMPALEETMQDMLGRINIIREQLAAEYGMDSIEHILARIKSEESMREKCIREGLPLNSHSALSVIHDAIGIRIVCAFINDIYVIRDHLASFEDITIIREKDYIRNAKPNGYRSYHMILKTASGFFIEIQLRTISMDTWAALEHHIRYKKDINSNTSLIADELKRCADELASTDISMQTIRDLIMETVYQK